MGFSHLLVFCVLVAKLRSSRTGLSMTIKIVNGDALTVLRTMKSNCIQCVVTSPPYFGLRDYGIAGQVGLEANPNEYVQKLVEIFRETHRVLRDDGTLWLNLGDSYAGSGRGGNPDAGTKQGTNAGSQTVGVLYGRDQSSADQERLRIKDQQENLRIAGFKPKDLIGIPWRVAFALQQDGWYLRQDIIWAKPNPMPESVRDRCTKSHEYLFMFSKQPRYYFDADAIAEPVAASTVERVSQLNYANQKGSDRVPGKTNGPMKAVIRKQDGHGRRHAGFNERYFNGEDKPALRNRRSVWTITTKPFKEAHFATFPSDLVEPCVLAGSPEWSVILDPFAGSGTVGMVANKLNRHAILIELNASYCQMAERRCGLAAPLMQAAE